jgi:hypothetical protein
MLACPSPSDRVAPWTLEPGGAPDRRRVPVGDPPAGFYTSRPEIERPADWGDRLQVIDHRRELVERDPGVVRWHSDRALEPPPWPAPITGGGAEGCQYSDLGSGAR